MLFRPECLGQAILAYLLCPWMTGMSSTGRKMPCRTRGSLAALRTLMQKSGSKKRKRSGLKMMTWRPCRKLETGTTGRIHIGEAMGTVKTWADNPQTQQQCQTWSAVFIYSLKYIFKRLPVYMARCP